MATKTQTTKPLTQIERIAAVHPKYAALLVKNHQLNARYDEIQTEVNPRGWVPGTFNEKTGAVTYHDVPLGEQARTQPSWTEQLPKPVVKPVVRHSGAVALLGDLLPEQPPEEIAPPQAPPSWPGQDRYRALGAELDTIVEALRLIAIEIPKARLEYSRLVVVQRGGEHKAIAENVVDAARALGDAIIKHHNFINEQRLDGVSYQKFRPLNLERFSNLNEPSSPLMRTILDAVENNLVDSGKIPDDWKMPADISLFQGGN